MLARRKPMPIVGYYPEIGRGCIEHDFVPHDVCERELDRALRVTWFGDVNAERFITLLNREPFDYTEWRKDHLFVGETVDSLMDEARALYGEDYANRQDASLTPA